jgi:hypothetical protein
MFWAFKLSLDADVLGHFFQNLVFFFNFLVTLALANEEKKYGTVMSFHPCLLLASKSSSA